MGWIAKVFGGDITFYEYVAEKERLKKEAKWLMTLDMNDTWRGAFFNLGVSRGFRDMKRFSKKMVEISKSDSEVVRLMLEDKLVGVDTLHIIATRMSPQCQTEYYKAVKKNGVKSPEAMSIMERCKTGGPDTATLLDFMV
jgi:hypothetical protein